MRELLQPTRAEELMALVGDHLRAPIGLVTRAWLPDTLSHRYRQHTTVVREMLTTFVPRLWRPTINTVATMTLERVCTQLQERPRPHLYVTLDEAWRLARALGVAIAQRRQHPCQRDLCMAAGLVDVALTRILEADDAVRHALDTPTTARLAGWPWRVQLVTRTPVSLMTERLSQWCAIRAVQVDRGNLTIALLVYAEVRIKRADKSVGGGGPPTIHSYGLKPAR